MQNELRILLRVKAFGNKNVTASEACENLIRRMFIKF